MYSLALASTATLRLVQITDTHLFGPEDGRLLGMNTLHSMHSVLDIVHRERAHIDSIMVTGDLSQDGSVHSYQHLHQATTRFNCPVFWLEGNHDTPHSMHQVAAGTEHLQRVIRTPHWQLILLNSQVEGAVFGQLANEQLQLLQDTLQQRPDLYTLVSLHHHPLPMGSHWLDNIGVRNSAALINILRRYHNVRCVLWGHVHQASDRIIDGVRYLSSPSTCVQFAPNSVGFTLDNLAPGYRWLDLHADGSIDTGVCRVEGIAFEIDYSLTGY